VGILDLLLPERCAACGREGPALCEACRSSLTRLTEPLCARCGAPVAWPVARCRECAGRRVAFERARAAVGYEGAAVRLVWAWKQAGRRGLTPLVADIVAGAVAPPAVDAVLPVPPVRARELWRGHNPAQGLALALSRAWGIPAADLLARSEGRPQRGLGPRERRRNVEGVFAARGRVPAAVLLVDDVYTTGSTASAAAQALRRAGAVRVEIVTFARALRDGRSRAA
jgi:ComF family protein